MFKSVKVPSVFAHLGLECPASSASDVMDPAGKAPGFSDLVTLHIPLHSGSDVREDVEGAVCPGIADHEQMLDDSDEEKPGSVRITVTRKKWGTYLMQLHAEGLDSMGLPVLRMEGARLKGKPSVSVFKGVPPVLEITMRGALTDGSGATSDEIRRRWVHSRLLLTLSEQQMELPLSGSEEDDLSRTADAAQAAPVPAKKTGPVEGSRSVGPRENVLPEHSFTSVIAMKVAEEMERVHSGFLWLAIQQRQKSKPGVAVMLGWTELTAAATAKRDVVGMKAIRERLEAAATGAN
jgi:hypothetical protein